MIIRAVLDRPDYVWGFFHCADREGSVGWLVGMRGQSDEGVIVDGIGPMSRNRLNNGLGPECALRKAGRTMEGTRY